MKLVMNRILHFLLLLSLVVTGCVTKAQADAQARMAFLAGQNQALMRMQANPPATQTAHPTVGFIGPVQESAVPWHRGLMLSEAIVKAQYTGSGDPAGIVIHRNEQSIPINPKGLLKGEDFLLQGGDVVEIQP